MPLSHFYQGDNMKITAKFGGTSLATAKAIDNAAKIVASDTARRYVTVSAPGKRSPDDIKITDLLYSAYESGDFDAVFERFYDIAHELRTKTELSAEYRKIKDAMRIPCGRDFIASRGEYLCAVSLNSETARLISASTSAIPFFSARSRSGNISAPRFSLIILAFLL